MKNLIKKNEEKRHEDETSMNERKIVYLAVFVPLFKVIYYKKLNTTYHLLTSTFLFIISNSDVASPHYFEC